MKLLHQSFVFYVFLKCMTRGADSYFFLQQIGFCLKSLLFFSKAKQRVQSLLFILCLKMTWYYLCIVRCTIKCYITPGFILRECPFWTTVTKSVPYAVLEQSIFSGEPSCWRMQGKSQQWSHTRHIPYQKTSVLRELAILVVMSIQYLLKPISRNQWKSFGKFQQAVCHHANRNTRT